MSSTTAHAAIIKNLDELRVIQVPLSQEGLTRIKVQEDRILHVFGNAGEYVLEIDENQGQVFIRPKLSEEEANIKPISLTLTTEGGHTQDLRLIPKHQAPEAIILKSDNALKHENESSFFWTILLNGLIEQSINIGKFACLFGGFTDLGGACT